MGRSVGKRLTYANVMSTIAAFAALATGGAYAADKIGPKDIAKNAVRAKHIRANSVRAKHIGANAVRSSEVKNDSLTGVDVKEATLGQVSRAAQATLADAAINASHADRAASAGNATNADFAKKAGLATEADEASTVNGFSAGCLGGEVLIRGICFDSTSNAAVGSVKTAADACAGRGGWLPTPLQLYSTRGILNLGTGVGSDLQFTDAYYANTAGVNYRTIVVDGTGAMIEHLIENPAEYICAYPLVG